MTPIDAGRATPPERRFLPIGSGNVGAVDGGAAGPRPAEPRGKVFRPVRLAREEYRFF